MLLLVVCGFGLVLLEECEGCLGHVFLLEAGGLFAEVELHGIYIAWVRWAEEVGWSIDGCCVIPVRHRRTAY